MGDFVAVGYSCLDIYPKEQISYATGNGVDVAVHLQRENYQTALVSAVGDDSYGEQMLRSLQQEKIDVTHVHEDKGDTAQIHMKLIEGDRVHDSIKDGVMSNFHLTDADREFIKKFTYLHTDYFGRIYGLLEEFQEAGVKVVFDFSTFADDKDFELICPFVDIGQFSVETIDKDLEQKLKDIHNMGVKIVIATAGAQGALAYDGKKLYRQLALPVKKIVNTVGCGDAFLAGFLLGQLKGANIVDSLVSAAEKSQQVIQKFTPY